MASPLPLRAPLLPRACGGLGLCLRYYSSCSAIVCGLHAAGIIVTIIISRRARGPASRGWPRMGLPERKAEDFYGHHFFQGDDILSYLRKSNILSAARPQNVRRKTDKPIKGGCLSRIRRSRFDEFTRGPPQARGDGVRKGKRDATLFPFQKLPDPHPGHETRPGPGHYLNIFLLTKSILML